MGAGRRIMSENWCAMSSATDCLESYEPLRVTVMEVSVERGYRASGDDYDTGEVDDLWNSDRPEE